MLIAGDFKSKSLRRGANTEDNRGVLLNKWIEELEAEVANKGEEPTFERGTQESHIDVTVNSLNLTVKNWRILTEENLSDHRTIMLDIKASALLN